VTDIGYLERIKVKRIRVVINQSLTFGGLRANSLGRKL